MTDTTNGHSYSSALYDTLEARMEAKYHLPVGGMRAIRTLGERSNADQVSSAGARSVYQIIPATRDGLVSKYNVDPYRSPEGAAEGAAILLRDSMKRNGGSWAAAVGEYHGGTNRDNWGPINSAYRQRVLGTSAVQPTSTPATPSVPVPHPHTPSTDELLFGTPDQVFNGDDAALLEAKRAIAIKEPSQSVEQMTRGALLPVGDWGGLPTGDTSGMNTAQPGYDAEVAAQQKRDSVGVWEATKSAFKETLTGRIIGAIGAEHGEFDPQYTDWYKRNWQDVESFAKSDKEVDQLRDATNHKELEATKARILEDRKDAANVDAMGPVGSTALRLGTGFVDPASWAATMGVGKALQMGGVGARALMSAGRTGEAFAAAGAEGALGNLSVTAGLDAAGDRQSGSDYALSALTGLAIGVAHNALTYHSMAKRGQIGADLLHEDIGDGYHTVYQGSPSAPFEAHDYTKLGTGEGNHAQGKGHYTSESFQVGRWYWNTLAGATDAERLAAQGASEGEAQAVQHATAVLDDMKPHTREWAQLPKEDQVGEARGIFRQMAGMAWDKITGWLRSFAQKAMNALDNPSGIDALERDRLKFRAGFTSELADKLDAEMREAKGGTIYKVRIRKGDYLDWEKPLSEQPQSVQDKVRQAGFDGPAEATGKDVYRALASKLPPVPEGHVRMWRGGSAGESGRGGWYTTHRPYAEGYSLHNGGDLWFADVSREHPVFDDGGIPERTPENGFTFSGDFGPDEVVGRRVKPGQRLTDAENEAATSALRDAGILGNKYQTAAARAGHVAPEHNYVSFNDHDISIEKHWTPTEGWVSRAQPKAFTDTLARQIGRAVASRGGYLDGVRKQVKADMGEGAAPEAVEAAVQDRVRGDHLDVLKAALADVPDDQRLLVAEHMLTENPEARGAVISEHGLDAVSEEGDRNMIAEMIARSKRLIQRNGYDKKKLNTILEKVDMEATATRLLKSESPVARAVGLTLLENPTGVGGRRRTAAMALAQRERIYNEAFAGYDTHAARWRKAEGISLLEDHYSGLARNEFNKRVFNELEARVGQREGVTFDQSPHVVAAADLFQHGMDLMRREQQHVGTIGAARLGEHSIGYVPHRLDPRKVMTLTAEQNKAVRGVLSEQFQRLSGWDREFSDKLAAKYLERAIDSAAGRYHVPVNLHSPEASEIVRSALEGMGMGYEDIEKLMGKFSRGGAGHTKSRLQLDLTQDIGDGAKLGDLFVNDVPTLYRSYARRVAGDVALAQYGIMGKKGLDLLGKAITASGGTPHDIEAFNQVAAEFLNMPYGNANHKWMDNLRIATSASRLGGMAFTQFAEFGNAIAALGFRGAMTGVAELPRMMREVRAIARGEAVVNPMLKDLDRIVGHVGLDDYHQTRLFDVRDTNITMNGSETAGLGTRTLKEASHAMMVMSGHRIITASQTRGMAELIARKAILFARDGGDATALRDMGISEALERAIKDDLPNIAEFDRNGNLKGLDLFKGEVLTHAQIAEFAQAIERGAGQIIQRTYIGETGKWAHSGLLKVLAQFRTFSLISVEKQWGRNVNNYGALRSYMTLMGSMGFAVPIHLAKVQANMLAMDEAKRQKYWENAVNPLALMRATLNYASASGLAGDIMDIGAGFASSYGGDFGQRFGQDYGIKGKSTSQFFGGTVAPSVGLANDLWKGVIKRDVNSVARSLPGGNLPYTAPFVSAAAHAANDKLKAAVGPTVDTGN